MKVWVGLAIGGLMATACGQSSKEETASHAAPVQSVRFATYNVFLNRAEEGLLLKDLRSPDNIQIGKVAEIIQRTAPDVLLLNEFDYDAAGEGLALFKKNYLEVSQNGAPPAIYPHVFFAPSNTGVASGHDLDRSGAATSVPGSRDYGGDAFGYGEFPGQYAMALLSKYPIDEKKVRTFQKFLWKDMPGAMLPDDPATPAAGDWYGAAAMEEFRLSSKSHWDVPVNIDGTLVHILAAHPTPPSFDGDEDRNGKRNHDEIRFWADYIEPGAGAYIYDDRGGRGGLKKDARFVIMGDLNADPLDGDAGSSAISTLLHTAGIALAPFPKSTGGAVQSEMQGGANAAHDGPPEEDTADFNDDPDLAIGNLHLDYVLFSKAGLQEAGSGVFWPGPDEEYYDLVGPGFPVESSDHRLVWRDLVLTDE